MTEPAPIARPALVALGAGTLLAALAAGAFALATQLRGGLAATGLSQGVQWGTTIINMMFFLGISYGALLVAVALRIVGGPPHAVRAAELLALAALLVGGPQGLVDLGRPDRVGALLDHLHLASPMAWDILAISTYSAVLLVYVWFAQRRQAGRATLSLGLLAAAAAVAARVALALVPGLSPRPLWHSPLIVPVFLLGTAASGIAALVLLLAAPGLRPPGDASRDAITVRLGRWLAWASLAWAWMTLAEHLLSALSGDPAETAALALRLCGDQAPIFWAMAACMAAVPALLLSRAPTIPASRVAAALALAGAWLEKWTVLVPSQMAPRIPGAAVPYGPTWVEGCELVASAAALLVVLALLARFLPGAGQSSLEPALDGPTRGHREA